jgi:hypothetical protein
MIFVGAIKQKNLFEICITKACCVNHCVVWTVFPLVPRYKTAANAKRYVLGVSPSES